MSEKIEVSSKELEITRAGNANGISLQLKELFDRGEIRSLNSEEKEKIINEATIHFGRFLEALGCDYKNDPNSRDTPKRVAKAYVNDLWKGRYEIMSEITAFPSDGYGGIIMEKGIPLSSQCSHHHQSIAGTVAIAYIPGPENLVVGLSKLNRLVNLFGQRGAIQEQLTIAIHEAMNKIVPGNRGVMVVVHATHSCVSCRGVRHQGASMLTSEVSGVFSDSNDTAKQEVLEFLKLKI